MMDNPDVCTYELADTSSEYYDYEFTVQGTRVAAKKSVLANQSPVFKAHFDRPVQEIASNDDDEFAFIDDIKLPIFHDFMRYLHSGTCASIHHSTVEMLAVAVKYCVKDLCVECENEMLHKLSVHNAINHLVAAVLLDRVTLAKQIVEFIKRNPARNFDLGFWRLIAGNLDLVVALMKLFYSKQYRPPKVEVPPPTLNENEPTGTLSWDRLQVTWTLNVDYLDSYKTSVTELTSPPFFVIFPKTSSVCVYYLFFQRYKCSYCRTNFKAAVCQLSPKSSFKLIGKLENQDCLISDVICKRLPDDRRKLSKLRVLQNDQPGIDYVKSGYLQCIEFGSLRTQFTFTLDDINGCQFNPLCRFVVGGEIFFCNSHALTISPYLTHLFHYTSKLQYKFEDDVSLDDFIVIVCYLTNLRLPAESSINHVLLRLANEFKLHHLSSVCEQALVDRITPATAIFYYVVGHDNSAHILKERAKNCIKIHMLEIDDSDWNILQDVPELMRELLLDLMGLKDV